MKFDNLHNITDLGRNICKILGWVESDINISFKTNSVICSYKSSMIEITINGIIKNKLLSVYSRKGYNEEQLFKYIKKVGKVTNVIQRPSKDVLFNKSMKIDIPMQYETMEELENLMDSLDYIVKVRMTISVNDRIII